MIKLKSILAISIVVLFIGMSFNPVTANEISDEDQTYTLKLATIADDGSTDVIETTLTETEFSGFLENLEKIDQLLEKATSREEVMDIIRTFPFFNGKHPILSWLLNLFSIYQLPRSRAFVFSHGWGYKINPLKGNIVDMYRPFTMWQYSSRSRFTIPIPAKSFIIRFSPFDINFLQGTQVGFMTRFIGLYIHISQPLPQKSYTFFLGSARHIGGLDFKLSPLLG
jgi:hypothetical protein